MSSGRNVIDGCSEVEQRLSNAVIGGGRGAAADLAHAASCASCAHHLADLRAIAALLSESFSQSPDPAKTTAARRAAAVELAAAHAAQLTAPTARRLPTGYGRELARILGWALLPLPLAVFAYVQLFRAGAALLGGLLPEPALFAFGVAAALVASSWLALVYGALPFVALGRLSTLRSEVSPWTS